MSESIPTHQVWKEFTELSFYSFNDSLVFLIQINYDHYDSFTAELNPNRYLPATPNLNSLIPAI